MEAYGQFAWKLRHYRRGPPESNHSSNSPVCRHLGGRLVYLDVNSTTRPIPYGPKIPVPLLFSISNLMLAQHHPNQVYNVKSQ
ncbi:hypothetical protein M0802_005037 [Mischocyttarus mexicanus]|nr:hypothetical protein M0802_005037 [Mischocyttarus mexicanus]